MSNPSKVGELHLLHQTEASILYRSKRNRNSFGECGRQFRSNEHFLPSSKRYCLGGERRSLPGCEQSVGGRESWEGLKRKLRHILQPNPEECNAIEYAGVETDPTKKPPPRFRLNFFHTHHKKKQYLSKLTHKQQQPSPQHEHFQASNICLKRREDFHSWKQPHCFEFPRDLLRTHGEDKCFSRAVKFRGSSDGREENGLSLKKESSSRQVMGECWMEIETRVEPWKRMGRDEWAQMSDLGEV